MSFFLDFHGQRNSPTLITPNCAAGHNCCGQIFAISLKIAVILTKSLCFGSALTTIIRLSVDYPQSGRIQCFNRRLIKSWNWFRPVVNYCHFDGFPTTATKRDNMAKLHPKGLRHLFISLHSSLYNQAWKKLCIIAVQWEMELKHKL